METEAVGLSAASSRCAAFPIMRESSIQARRIPIVAVPARDEVERLGYLIAALGKQSWLNSVNAPLQVILVLNNCTDQSFAAATNAAARFPEISLDIREITFPIADAHVGSARRLALQLALEHDGSPEAVALLTTDADAIPDRDWIARNLDAIEAGADLVGGRLVGDSREEALLGEGFVLRAGSFCRYADCADRLTSLLDPLPHDPWPRHHDHTGASLCVRGEVYAALGGIPALPNREDLAFVSAARAAGFRLRHAPDVIVSVSARLHGRAPLGMAACIRSWLEDEHCGRNMLVEPPQRIADRARLRAALRALPESDTHRISQAADLGLAPGDLHDSAGDLLPTAALVERWAPDEPDAAATMPLAQAMAEIERLIAELEEARIAA